MGCFDEEPEPVYPEDYELLAFENKRMAEFIASLGLSNDSISNRVINGSDSDVEVARHIIFEKIVYEIKYKMQDMNSNEVLTFIISDDVLDFVRSEEMK